MGLKTRIRKSRRGEPGATQVEHFDEESGMVVATHQDDGRAAFPELAQAHEEFRQDFDSRSVADRAYCAARGREQAQRAAAERP